MLDTPKDLGHHRCIALRENNEDATMWRFTQASGRTEMNIRISPVLSSNVSQVTKDWCVAGQGIIQRSEWDVQEELENGQLVRVLSSYQLESADIVALLSSERLSRSRKVTAFLEFMQQRLQERLAY